MKSVLFWALLSVVTASHGVEKRNHYTSTVFVTVTAAPVTETVNPLDPTITKSAGWTVTSGPGPSISTITSSCIRYSHRLPPVGHEAEIATYTFTTHDTVTVTDTNRPLTTQTEYYTPVVTVSTARATYLSYHCLNTLVVSYADFPGAVYTWTSFSATAYTTDVCLTSSTRSTTIPGVTLRSSSVPLQDWEYFSTANLATKYTVDVISTTILAAQGTATSTVCEKSQTVTATRAITVTKFPSTTTVVFTCGNGITGSYTPPAITRRDSPGSGTEAVSTSTPEGQTQTQTQAEARTEKGKETLEIHTIIYKTVTVLDNTIRTLTGTAIVDVAAAEFTQTRVEYVTSTVATGVATVSSCVFPWVSQSILG